MRRSLSAAAWLWDIDSAVQRRFRPGSLCASAGGSAGSEAWADIVANCYSVSSPHLLPGLILPMMVHVSGIYNSAANS